MDQTIPAWKRMRFKTNKVWLATDAGGNAIIKNNRVLIKYQLDQEHEYWVHPEGVTPIEPQGTLRSAGSAPPAPKDPATTPSTGGRPKFKAKRTPPTETHERVAGTDAVCIFADGASSGNPGPAGIGIVLRYGTRTREISKPIGIATNNIAELEAIRIGLLEIKKTDLPVRIFSDSSYAQGVLALGWKARKNQKLIKSIQQLMATFADLQLIKVKGHSGVPENERADLLATTASRLAGRDQNA